MVLPRKFRFSLFAASILFSICSFPAVADPISDPNGDADGDTIPNFADVDFDGDGNPDNGVDSDGDGINDAWDLNPYVHDTPVGGSLAYAVADPASAATAYADMRTWVLEGASGGNWVDPKNTGQLFTGAPSGRSVLQTVNNQAGTMFLVSNDDNVINRAVWGTIEVLNGSADDDWVGFAMGYQNTDGDAFPEEYIGFTWNASGTAPYSLTAGGSGTGLFLVHANPPQANTGNPTGGGTRIIDFHTGTGRGWQEGTEYRFRILYTTDLIRVYIDNELVLESTAENAGFPEGFPAGQFGFTNASQSHALFGNVREANASAMDTEPFAADDRLYYGLTWGAPHNETNVLDTDLEPNASGILDNDYDPDGDLFWLEIGGVRLGDDGDPATVDAYSTTITGAEGGSFQIFDNGRIVYTAPADYQTKGPFQDTMEYSLVDEDGSSTARVTITVQETNTTPDSITLTDSDTDSTVDIRVKQGSAPGTLVGILETIENLVGELDEYDYELEVASNGAFSINGNQLLVRDTAALDRVMGTGNESHTITIRSTDTEAQFVSQTFIIHVDPNELPTSADGSVDADAAIAFAFKETDFSFTDTDAGDEFGGVRIINMPTSGTLFIDNNHNNVADSGEVLEVNFNDVVSRAYIHGGIFKYLSESEVDVVDQFTFRVNDGTAYSASDYTMTVNVDADKDDDGIPNIREIKDETDIDDATDYLDTDGDGVPDYVEEVEGTDPTIPTSSQDTDGDGVPDYVETLEGTNPNDPTSVNDTDKDGVPDYLENLDDTDPTEPTDFKDSDEDGVPDFVEIKEGTSPIDPTSVKDTDEDGVPDYLENRDDTDPTDPSEFKDDDGDGVPDYVEVHKDDTDPTDPQSVKDTDKDGVPDYVENLDGTDPTEPTEFTDSDKDGIPDFVEIVEGTSPTDPTSAKDTDEDGVPDYVENVDGTDPTEPTAFKDSDVDGVPDYVEIVEGTSPTDPTSVKDTDEDGVPDYVENVDDTDPNEPSEFKDNDGDGVPDYVEVHKDDTDPTDPQSVKDTDKDGVPDYVENRDDTDPNEPTEFKDIDGDGVPDHVEVHKDGTDPADPQSVKDTDSDGVPDYVETVDGTDPDSEGGFRDTDGDGVPDYIERSEGTSPTDRNGYKDSDGDGVPDYVEAVVEKTNPLDANDFADMDKDGIPDYKDTDNDNDGISDEDEGRAMNRDTDSDGIPDYLDLDSDIDGLLDILEGTRDADSDGVPDYLDSDSDNDGIPDYIEAPLGIKLSSKDADKDGIDDAIDVSFTGGVDLNNNGIDDAYEPRDTDSDGIPDYLDPDSDGDGIPDRLEADVIPLSGIDSDGDGIDDFLDVDQTRGRDLNGNGIDDEFEPADTDGDGIPDHLDRDSDNDGIADGIEGGASGLDSDGDGIDDAFDVDQTGGTDANGDGIDDAAQMRDSDGDGIPDMRDLDSDNDGIYDVVEAGLADKNWDGLADGGVITDNPSDRDGDGTPDYLDLDSDNDGIYDVIDAGFGRFDEGKDGRIDDMTDVDRDGIPDVVDYEIGSFGGSLDSDDDGIPDALDRDDDNDGIPDWIENGFSSPDQTGPDRDTDGDGIPDRLDLDSDNDGIPDILESGLRFLIDANGDGRIDDFVDSDGNGLHDTINDLLASVLDTDADGISDFQDLDSDGDGIWDLVEAGFNRQLDANNDGRIDVFVDLDRDGIADSVDTSVTNGVSAPKLVIRDTDNDGIPDYLDTDSDNDGFTDDLENGDFDNDGIPDNEQDSGKLETAVRGSGSMNVWLLGLLGLLGGARQVVLRQRRTAALVVAGGLSVLPAAQAAAADNCTGDGYDIKRCWYVGAGIGATHLDPEGQVNGWSTDDTNSTGFELHLGQRFTPHWFWELRYTDMGEAGLGNLNPSLDQLISDASVSYDLPSLMAGYLLWDKPYGFNLYAKAGVSAISTSANDSRIGMERQTSTQLAVGAGMQYRFKDSPWFVRLELDSYDRDANILGLSLSRYFGGGNRGGDSLGQSYAHEPANTELREQKPMTTEVPVFDGVLKGVNFPSDQAVLTSQAKAALNEVGDSLVRFPTVTVEVQGHTDNQGSSQYNMDLSQQRAAAVIQYLSDKGVDSSRLIARGFGESEPIATNDTPTGRASNRRVAFRILK